MKLSFTFSGRINLILKKERKLKKENCFVSTHDNTQRHRRAQVSVCAGDRGNGWLQ